MWKGKLVQLLKALSNQERKRLKLFLQSPYHNTKADLLQLFEVLDEQLFYLGIEFPEKETVWNALYQNQPFSEANLRTISSQLLKKVEAFMIDHALNRRAEVKNRLLTEELDRRKLDKHLHYAIQITDKQLESNHIRNGSHFLNRFQLEQIRHRYNSRQQFRSQELAPMAAMDALDTFFLATKLSLACELLNLQNILQLEVDIAMLDQLEQFLESSDHKDDPVVAIYYSVLNMLRKEDPVPSYRKLRSLIESTVQVLSREEQYEVYVHAINFCIRQANRGETNYLEELFALYRQALERDVLFDPTYLSPSSYKNIVTVGLRVNQHKWVRGFIGAYKKKLPPAFRENAYTYNLAKYYYNVEKYDKVLQLLQEVEYDDVFYNLDSKVMLLKIYYDQHESDALFSLFDSFSVFLRRNKVLSTYHKTINLNLIRFVKKLVSTPEAEKEKLKALADKIKATKQVTDINWLLARVDEKAGVKHKS